MSEKVIPISYTEQNGCHNCNNAFTKCEYDDYPAYFCKVNAPERPHCGSVLMDESYLHLNTEKEWDKAESYWEAWSKAREVSAWGVCLSWQALDKRTTTTGDSAND